MFLFILWRNITKLKFKIFNFSIFQISENAGQESQEESGTEESPIQRLFTGSLPTGEDISNMGENGFDPYLTFIKKAGARTLLLLAENPNLYVEIHHIVPRFLGGNDNPENLVKLTYNDHVIAHYIRWVVYGYQSDLLAFNIMRGQNPASGKSNCCWSYWRRPHTSSKQSFRSGTF